MTLNNSTRIKRALEAGNYIYESKCSLRTASDALGISKTTIHRDIHKVLPKIDKALYEKVLHILQYNFDTRGEGGYLSYSDTRIFRINEDVETKGSNNSIPVIYVESDNHIKYKSITEASVKTGYDIKTIQKHCRKEVKKIKFIYA